MEKYGIGADIAREDIAKLWPTEDLLGRGERELLVLHHRLKNYYLKSLMRLSRREIIQRKLIKTRKLTLCVAYVFGKLHKRPWSTKVKHSCGSIRKPSDTRPGAMT